MPFSEKIIGLLLKLIFISILVLLAALIFVFFSKDYEEFISWSLQLYGKSDKLQAFKSMLSPDRYAVIRINLLLFTGMYVTALFYFRKKIDRLAAFLRDFFAFIFYNIYQQYAQTSITERLIFSISLVVITLLRFIYLLKFPLNIDEAFSYVFFVSKGFAVTASYYPAPNNHILYNHLCVFSDFIFRDPLLVMKLPAFLAGVVLSGLIFVLFRKYFSFFVSYVLFLFFSFSPYIFYYSIHGRGYVLLIVCALVCMIGIVRAIEERYALYYWLLFILSAWAGFYTIPVFLFPFASFVVFGLVYSLWMRAGRKIKELMLSSFIVAVLTLISYLPVLLLSGPGAITGNAWVQPLSVQDYFAGLPAYLSEVNNQLWYIEQYGVVLTLLIVGGAILVLASSGRKQWALLLALVYLVPLALIMLKQLQPFHRVWTHLIILNAFSVAIFVDFLLKSFSLQKRWGISFAIFAGVVLMGLSVYHMRNYRSEVMKFYGPMNTFVDLMYAEKPEKVFVAEDTYNVFTRYKFLKEKGRIEVVTENPDPEARYDFVVVPREEGFPAGIDSAAYRLFHQNDAVQAFKME